MPPARPTRSLVASHITRSTSRSVSSSSRSSSPRSAPMSSMEAPNSFCLSNSRSDSVIPLLWSIRRLSDASARVVPRMASPMACWLFTSAIRSDTACSWLFIWWSLVTAALFRTMDLATVRIAVMFCSLAYFFRSTERADEFLSSCARSLSRSRISLWMSRWFFRSAFFRDAAPESNRNANIASPRLPRPGNFVIRRAIRPVAYRDLAGRCALFVFSPQLLVS
mmetsp:Transcript_6531/g.18052  ORF Transcript_6531/g.18052 Transcript_6531/m.18052 type:complete len:223 (-) Transcript_6531:219-887(-)